MSSLLKHFPRALLDDLVNGMWLPIVGAGFSRNAVVRQGDLPVTWGELAKSLADDVEGVDGGTSTLEIISAYEHAFGRVDLVSRTGQLIRVYDSTPGPAHIAFANVGFATVLTTNLDFLLERAYDAVGKAHVPIVEEAQLSAQNRQSGPRIIKFHGDINHPTRVVLTEDDYDQFLQTYPLLATSVTALLVDHTAVLIGYSLDDPDTRQLLALIRSRLGRMTRPLWTIQIAAPPHIVSRYERRGVKVVNLPAKRNLSIGDQFEQLFIELNAHWRRALPQTSAASNDRISADFRVQDEPSRMCYFAIPADLIGWYQGIVFPEVEARGLIPVTARDVFSPPGAISAKLDALIERSKYVVVEVTGSASDYEVGMALARKSPENVLIITAESYRGGRQFSDSQILVRPDALEAYPRNFIDGFRVWISRSTLAQTEDDRGPERLLELGEYGAAVISAVSLLEVSWATSASSELDDEPRPRSQRLMLREVRQRGLLEHPGEASTIEEALSKRNELLHSDGATVSPADARRYVSTIRDVVDRVRFGSF